MTVSFRTSSCVRISSVCPPLAVLEQPGDLPLKLAWVAFVVEVLEARGVADHPEDHRAAPGGVAGQPSGLAEAQPGFVFAAAGFQGEQYVEVAAPRLLEGFQLVLAAVFAEVVQKHERGGCCKAERV